MSVTVQIAFGEPIADAVLTKTIPGGIRIEADGKEVTRNVDQAHDNREAIEEHPNKIWWYDSAGQPLDARPHEYKGWVSVETTITELAKNVRTAKRGEMDLLEQLESPIVDSTKDIYLSYLDSQHELIRLAYMDPLSQVGTSSGVTVDAAVGYAVPLDELCLEVARCLREFVEFADAGDFDRSQPPLERVRNLANELESLATE